MNDSRLRELYERALAERSASGRRDCPEPEQLLALVRREGPESSRLETLDHSMQCADCRRELDLLRAIEQAGPARNGAGHASPGRLDLVLRRAVPLALAASAILAVGLVVNQRAGTVPGDEVMRGEAAQLSLRSPRELEVTVGTPVVLAWAADPSAARYLVEILDEDGSAVLSRSTTDTVLVARDVPGLAPGREYRWWVRAVDAGGAQRASPFGRLRVRNE